MQPDVPETFTRRARRAQLVECAIDTIAEVGYAQASVRKIAERADVGLSVVMHHIGHKDDLVAAVVAECYRSVLEVMVPAVTAQETARGRLAAHIRAHLGYIESRPAHHQALTEIAHGYRSADGRRLQDLDVPAEHLAEAAEVGLEAIFRRGIDSGEFRELSPESMASAVRGAIGSAMLRAQSDPGFDFARYADDLVDAFLRAAAADPTP
ncbi:TetR/AcrR family transcriptional regulator [Tsukamurella sp. 1534]|uniref:TetR/AcrR family transcriptional regulator n=1 Tax=Tsukamurella sp. 1534 TaxID=1151061 RepID=UPI0002F36531|nr:TetR/AcrR family transcriptional regulator [Tsukamurella sp. 1534]